MEKAKEIEKKLEKKKVGRLCYLSLRLTIKLQ